MNNELYKEYEVLADKLKHMINLSNYIKEVEISDEDYKKIIINEFSNTCKNIKKQVDKIKKLQMEIIEG